MTYHRSTPSAAVAASAASSALSRRHGQQIPTAPLSDAALLSLPASGWAWEFLRRNEAYRAAYRGWQATRRLSQGIMVVEPVERVQAWQWGLCFGEDPDLPYGEAAIAWHSSLDASVLPASATQAARHDRDAIDFRALGARVTVIGDGRHEHVLLQDGTRSLQIRVRDGSVLQGPVRLSFHMDPLRPGGPKTTNLKRFGSFLRTGTLAPAPHPDYRRTSQWLAALKLLPAADARLQSEEGLPAALRRSRALSLYLTAGGYMKILSRDNGDEIEGQPKPVRPTAALDAA